MTKSYSKKALEALIRIVEFILVLIIILDCNSVYRLRFGWNLEPKFLALWIANISAYLLILFYLLKDKTNLECIKNLKVLYLISFVFVFEFNALNALRNVGTGYLGYFFFFMNAMVTLYCIYRRNKEPFRLMYLMEYVVLFLAFSSFILWFGSSVLELLGKNLDIKVFWGGIYYDTNYLNLCFRRWVEPFTPDATKNLGIFVEPPMHGLFLGFGLYTELFLKKKSNLAIVGCFLLALISCRATLAMMIAIVAIAIVFADLIKEKKLAKIVIPFISIIAIIGVVCLFAYKMKTHMGSLATHIDDYVASFKCWLENPILGCGYDSEIPIQLHMSDFRSHNLGLSNSAGVVLAEGGIVLFTYYFLPFLFMMLAFFKKNPKLAYWGAGMCMFWIAVIFHTRLYVFFLLAFGYSMLELKVRLLNLKENEKRFELRFADFKDYLVQEGDSKTLWEKTRGLFRISFFELPKAFVMVMSLILTVVSVCAVLNVRAFSLSSIIVCAMIIVAELILFVLSLMKKQLKEKCFVCVQIALWGLFMLVGHAYQVLDSFLTATSLRLQDSWWRFVILSVVFYAIGCVYAVFINENKKEERLTNDLT
ncbi:MAG: hypothetical protein K6F31_02085 [Acetatifactor sp.]|nr:hypothetical protein [Acetatifactor sp.]